MTFTRSSGCRLLTAFALSALLLTGCGADADTELSMVEGAQDAETSQNDSTNQDLVADQPVELSTTEAPDNNEDENSLIPDAGEPPAPVAQSSPAERQRLQELGIVAPPASSPASPAAPAVASTGDADQADRNVDSTASGRDDLDRFPSSIPAIVAGAPQGVNRQDGQSPSDPSNSGPTYSAPEGETIIEGGDAVTSGLGGDATGVVSEGVGGNVASGLSLQPADANQQLVDLDPCASDGCTDDLAMTSGSGIGDAAPQGADGDTGNAADSGAVVIRVPADEVDCESRPWGRGCVLPLDDSGFWDPFTTNDGSTDNGQNFGDPNEDSAGDDGSDPAEEGVQVPQDVIDALLAPLDSDDGDGLDDSDESADGNDEDTDDNDEDSDDEVAPGTE